MSNELGRDAAQRRLAAARRLVATYQGPPRRVAFVATSYDTDFEPIAQQVRARIDEFIETFGAEGRVIWSFWLVDDLPRIRGFSDLVLSGFEPYQSLLDAGRLRCLRLSSVRRPAGGLKGRAILEGMHAALTHEPLLDALVYMNLNLKVHVAHSVLGLRQVLEKRCDVAVGSRWSGDGGLVIGGGRLGWIKSRVFSRIARTALPPLEPFVDTNAPMKVFSPTAARRLLDFAIIHHVTFDCEWLLIAQKAGLRMLRFPVVWIQRPGSSPPWHYTGRALVDVWRIRQRWRSGILEEGEEAVS